MQQRKSPGSDAVFCRDACLTRYSNLKFYPTNRWTILLCVHVFKYKKDPLLKSREFFRIRIWCILAQIIILKTYDLKMISFVLFLVSLCLKTCSSHRQFKTYVLFFFTLFNVNRLDTSGYLSWRVSSLPFLGLAGGELSRKVSETYLLSTTLSPPFHRNQTQLHQLKLQQCTIMSSNRILRDHAHCPAGKGRLVSIAHGGGPPSVDTSRS